MKTIKVFYSQPMNGRSIKEICEERIKMQQEFMEFLEEQGCTDYILQDVNAHFDLPAEILPYEPGILYYLGRSIQAMDRADYVCFSKNWTNAKGCLVEMNACCVYFDNHKHFVHGKHIRDICWGNNSGSKDLTVNTSNDA